MMLTRSARPILRPFVKTLWAVDQLASASAPPCACAPLGARERVLPTGMMHLAIRLSNPLELYDDIHDGNKRELGYAVIGGARSTYYVRDVSEPGVSVGAELLPGDSELFFGVPANELADRHTPLEDLWGQVAVEIRSRLVASNSLEERLNLFEELLINRVPRIHAIHPAVAHALEKFTLTTDVREVVKQTGYSHRRFIELFRRSVGLPPKLYCRVIRFQSVLSRSSMKTSAKIDIALDAGYSDQPHFNRQFREFAGVTPGEYEELAPSAPNHVPILQRIK